MSNPDIPASTAPPSKQQPSKGGLFSWARPRGRTKSKPSLPNPSLNSPPVLTLPPPTRSTSEVSATLRLLPQKPLPRPVHQARILYLALVPAGVKTALPVTRRNAFPSPPLGRLRPAAARRIHPSHPCLAIVTVLHLVKYGTADVRPLLVHLPLFPPRSPIPARLHLATGPRVVQPHHYPFPRV
ncbi:hypothetical protein BC826DRAFT_715421 [Russula brevipes]|nr:hypothetical protein BC826DRAFT_715421 [Russula brevipes]